MNGWFVTEPAFVIGERDLPLDPYIDKPRKELRPEGLLLTSI